MSNKRFITLDVFRGMTIFLMIVVNTQGSGAISYSQLEHSEWNGCTLTDMVFPSFLFAVGNALPFAMKKFVGQPDKIVLNKIFKRTFLLFLAGYLLSWYTTMHWNDGYLQFEPLAQMRVMGVLQRIALCYCAAALITHYASPRSALIWMLLFLFGYWLLLYMFGNPGLQYTITGNAVRKVDILIFGKQHLYKERGIIFDPEGLLSTIPAIANVLAGYLAGIFIIQKGKSYDVVVKFAIMGSLLILLALFWSYLLPINKKLWTSSYVFFTTGVDLIVLSILFYTIEIRQSQKVVNFFSVMGKNPLFIYVLSNLFLFFLILKVSDKLIFIDWINKVVFQKITPGPFGALLFSIAFTMILWSIAWIMDKRKIYIRL